MGLFDGKAKQEAAENEIMQKLSQIPLLDVLIQNVLDAEAEPWIQMSQSYYDNRKRSVRVVIDGFEIKWSSYREEQSQHVEEIHGRVGYSYTKSGYLPLHSYSYDNGKKEISVQRVCYLWASVIRERMAAKMPNCKFGAVDENATFTYYVPPLTFKDWF